MQRARLNLRITGSEDMPPYASLISNILSNPEDLDLSLLNSFFLNDIELQQANQIFNSALSANNLPTSPVQRYAK